MSESHETEPREFDAGEGAFHIFKQAGRAGWGGLLKLLAVYLIGYGLIYALFVWGFGPILTQLPDWISAEPERSELMAAFSRFWLALPAGLILIWVLYATIDAALLRWCFDRGAKIRFGGMELRLMLVELIIYVLLFLTWIPTFMLFSAGIGTRNLLLIVLGGLSVFVALGLMIFLAVKFAPAAALTVYRGHFSFFRAWRMSKGFFWGLLGAFVIIWVIYLALSIALQIASQPLMMIAMGDNAELLTASSTGQLSDAEALRLIQVLFSPEMMPVYIGTTLVSMVVYFMFQAVMAGTNAYAVKWRMAESAGFGALDVPPPSGDATTIDATSPKGEDPVAGGVEGPVNPDERKS